MKFGRVPKNKFLGKSEIEEIASQISVCAVK